MRRIACFITNHFQGGFKNNIMAFVFSTYIKNLQITEFIKNYALFFTCHIKKRAKRKITASEIIFSNLSIFITPITL